MSRGIQPQIPTINTPPVSCTSHFWQPQQTQQQQDVVDMTAEGEEETALPQAGESDDEEFEHEEEETRLAKVRTAE